MSSALSSPFMAESVAEVVPDIAKVAGRLSQSSVITGRRRVRLVPQSGQNYTSGASSGVVNILVQDGQAYADLLSACISFDIQTADSASAANNTVVDDGAWSVFRRCLVSVNSTLMDDTDFLAKKVNAEIYATASQDWYNSVGSFCGLWKYNTTTYGTKPVATATFATQEVAVSKYNVAAKIPLLAAKQQSNTTAIGGTNDINGTARYSIPVSLLSSFFRNDTLFPSRNAGQLYVQLNLASALEALYCLSTGSYSISNLTMEIDYVDLHPTYLEMMDGLIESPTGEGVAWAFDSHLVATQAWGSGATSGQNSVVVSKASQNLRSLQVLLQPSSAMSAGNYFAQSTFTNPGFKDIQFRIGSLYYPAFTAIGEARAFMDLQNAFGSPESIDKCGIVDNWNYYLGTKSDATAVVVNNNGLTGNGTASTTASLLLPASATTVVPALANNTWADMFMYAYCFDRLKHAKYHGIDLDGINTLTSAGSQMVVQLNANSQEQLTMTAIVRFTRILKLGGGATSVIG
jgi:hypothetical protein